MVDEILGQQQAVIKSLGKALTNIPGVAGGAILGDGRVGFILDTVDLVHLAHGQGKTTQGTIAQSHSSQNGTNNMIHNNLQPGNQQ